VKLIGGFLQLVIVNAAAVWGHKHIHIK